MAEESVIDLAGQRFGALTVISRIKPKPGAGKEGARWLCKCECGRQVKLLGRQLRRGNNTSCGCAAGRVLDLAGNTYGRLTVLKRVGSRHKESFWLCKCDCGRKHKVTSGNLVRGNTTSCGCLQKEHRAEMARRWSGNGSPAGTSGEIMYSAENDRSVADVTAEATQETGKSLADQFAPRWAIDGGNPTPVRVVIVTEPKSAPSQRSPKLDARDQWLYEQCLIVEKPHKAILAELNRIAKEREWPTLKSHQGVAQAAEKYAERNGLEPLPARQGF